MSAPRYAYVLLDSRGEWCGTYRTRAEAMADAWGPRFRDGYRVVRYVKEKR